MSKPKIFPAETRDGRKGWGVVVSFGGVNGFETDHTAVVFEKREQAEVADISCYSKQPGWLGYVKTTPVKVHIEPLKRRK